jgi:hypothetical protein
MLVAGFQLLKAGFLVFLFAKLWPSIAGLAVARDMSSDRLLRDVFILLLPCAALYSLVLSWGLWRLENWSRKILLVAIVDCWMLGFISWNGLFFSSSILLSDLKWKALAGVLMIDLLTYGCLRWYPGVSEAFGERE